MLSTVVVCIVFMQKNNISVKNVDALTQYLTGGTLTIALMLTAFSVVKSFALIFFVGTFLCNGSFGIYEQKTKKQSVQQKTETEDNK